MQTIFSAQPLNDLRIKVTFDDGVTRVVDIRPLIAGSVFEKSFRDPNVFEAVKLYPRGRGIYWPNNFDLCPDMLHDFPFSAA